jgi:ABC-type Fe3+/spermidine/putrescine transport system ATPase subunit
MDSHVSVIGVSKSFDKHKVLHQVSLEIPRGAFVTLLGPSGCGKTTLLRIIAGFYEAEAGEVWIEGRKVSGIPPHERNTPMVFQDYALFPHMTVAENIGYGLKLRKFPRLEIQERCNRVMKQLDLQRFNDRAPAQLSGGQQQRVALARALVLDPTIILLDEPLSNLDARLRVEIRSEIRELQQRMNLTVINVTHDQEEAMAISDIIAVMSGGRLAQVGAPTDLYFQPQCQFVAEFIGVANLIPGEVKEQSSGFMVATKLGRFVVAKGSSDLKVGQACFVMIRPQGLEFANALADNSFRAKLTNYTFLGSTVRYNLKADDLNLRLDETASADGIRSLNQEVWLHFSSDKAFVVSDSDQTQVAKMTMD